MSLSLANAITEVRYVLNEPTAAFWSDAEITAWIKEGTRIFASKSLLVENTNIVDPMIVSTPYYDSADESFLGSVMEIYSVIYFDGTSTYKGLIKIHPKQIGNVALSTAGPPKYYCLFNRNLYIFPLASAAVAAAGTLEILGSIETDDITIIQDEYQHLPIIYAIAKAKQKDEKFGDAATLLSQFFQEISFERQDKHSREVDLLEDFRIKTNRKS